MKKYFPWTAVVMVAALCMIQAHAGQQVLDRPQAFTGEIMDKLCAMNRSHDQMIQDMKSMGRGKGTCTTKCVQLGAKYTLFDAASGNVYEIEQQDKVEKFAGVRVRIAGMLHKNTITIEKIEPAL